MPRVRTTSLLAAVTLVAAVAAACGSDGGTTGGAAAPDPTSPAPTSSAPASSAPTSSSRASATPSSAPGRPTHRRDRHQGDDQGRHKVGSLGSPTDRSDAEAHLLAADRLPRVAGRTWTVGTTTSDDTAPVGGCQKTPLGTIGAVEAVHRTYTAGAGLTATQVVGRFADARSAWRAHQVLVAWRDDCESRVDEASVGPLRPVTVPTGTADSYRGTFAARAAGLGVLRTGSYVTLVEVSTRGDDYPTSWDPTRVAVRRIARTF
ncbi:hypothetical protein [Nocardioides sp.]|uniref:hypothetical protein n=1 Tax=Nocardioides sp. TaxID=35761 RepID=UPI003783749C